MTFTDESGFTAERASARRSAAAATRTARFSGMRYTDAMRNLFQAIRKQSGGVVARLARLLAGGGAIAVAAAAGAEADEQPAAAPLVEIVTSVGTIKVRLQPNRAPRTVANFLALVDERFYDGLVFHRVVKGFVVQAGGHDAELNPRPAPRSVVNESVGGLANTRGTLAMARRADPDSADTQFYVNLRDSPSLDAKGGKPGYTVFGRVVAGMDVVERIAEVETGTRLGMRDVPLEAVVIASARRVDPAGELERQD